MTQLLDLDDRRRTTLSKVGHHRRYLAEELADGTVVLHPAVVMTEVQARLLGAPDLLFALTEANALETEALVRRPRPQRRRAKASGKA